MQLAMLQHLNYNTTKLRASNFAKHLE